MENEKNPLDKYVGRELQVRLDRYDKQVAMFSLHDDDIPVATEVFKALGNEIRLEIIKMAFHGNTRVSEIGKKLNLGNSTVLFHIEVLRKAGLIRVDYEPNKKRVRAERHGKAFYDGACAVLHYRRNVKKRI